MGQDKGDQIQENKRRSKAAIGMNKKEQSEDHEEDYDVLIRGVMLDMN